MNSISSMKISLIALFLATLPPVLADDAVFSLAGPWRFELDPSDAGVAEHWFERALTGTIHLPGGLTEQGVGNPISVDTPWVGGIVDRSWFTDPEYGEYRRPGNIKVPFWLQPELYYAGAAWFQRDVEIPDSWSGRRIVLFLERAHWETRLWVDDRPIGSHNALAAPHEYDLGITPAGRHTLTLRVDNRVIIDIGENSHSISDHTQGNWNGIVGRIELRSTPPTWIEDLQVYPQIAPRFVKVRGRLGHLGGSSPPATIELAVWPADRSGDRRRESVAASSEGTFTATVALGNDAKLWDEFHPALYVLEATVKPADGMASSRRVRFGLREIATHGTQFTINGRNLFFRGTLECAIFPKTGHPPTEVEEWKRIIGVCRDHGLNMMRFHSWCPPEAAFQAADESGFYLHVECSSWANQSTTLGDGRPVDDWIYTEANRILKAYGNHPSFVLFLYGNEPGGDHHREFLAQWVNHYQALDPRRLVSAAAGWPQIQENQFHVDPAPRIQAWGAGLQSRINARPPETTSDYRDYIRQHNVPIISHEIGQWCVYPNFEEMRKYTGYLKPRNFEIFYDRLKAHGLAGFAGAFLHASGKLQALCYKEDIEAALRTPGMGGFQLLDLHDFPGQGTALVGVLDPFWEAKGYITAREFHRFCNSNVPLVRLPKRVFTNNESLVANIEAAHFGPEPLQDITAEWKLVTADETVRARGTLPPQDVPINNGVFLGHLKVNLAEIPVPAQCRLIVNLRGTEFENDWDLWVYPAAGGANLNSEVMVTSNFDTGARDHLRRGGSLLLSLPGERVRNYEVEPVKLGFSSIFWNTAWTRRQAPTTLGILCDPSHPALARFPTDSHSNWQWWYLLHRAGAIRLDVLPPVTEPIVRVIDDWFTARPLALIAEGRIGPGKIIVCGFDLTHGADDPVSRQMRSSLVHYMNSARFQPATEWTLDQIQSLIRQPAGKPHNDDKISPQN